MTSIDPSVITPDGGIRVFVYGSLRPGLHNYPILHSVKHLVERAVIPNGGVLYDNSQSFPYLVMSALDEPMDIQGEMLTVAPDSVDDAIRLLNNLEGYHGPNDPANHYERKIVDVEGVLSGSVKAYTYYAARGNLKLIRELPKVESGDWLTYVLNYHE